MRHRPVNWTLVSVGLMGVGIGAIGVLFYFLSGTEQRKPVPVASCAIAGIGATSILVGWFYDPQDQACQRRRDHDDRRPRSEGHFSWASSRP